MSAGWLEWFRALYPVIVTLASLSGLGIVLWLGTKFATKAAVDKLNVDVTGHDTRIKVLEQKADASPTRQELSDEISELSERMAGVETGVKGLSKQLDTANNYLHTLIGEGIKKGRGQ